jgi:hypothetical protein
MVSCQEASPLKESKHSLQCHPHDAALVNAHSFVSMGVEARCCPCHSAAHCQHMKRQPLLIHCCCYCGHFHCNCRHRLHHRCRQPYHCRCHGCCHCLCHCHCCRHCCRPSPIAVAAAVTVVVRHCCRGCHSPSRPPSPLCCRQPLPLPSPSPLAIAISVTVVNCSHHLHLPLLPPLQSAIAKIYCLGAARIIFKQFKQIMLFLFYFVRTVGGALIKSG